MDVQTDFLMEEARSARKNAYCPYSGYAVGAALLCEDGTIFHGCNVENSAFGPSNCAERTAVFAAVAEGRRNFRAIAISGGPQGEEPQACYPCGVCRQVLAEFCGAEFPVIVQNEAGEIENVELGGLLPRSFQM